MSGRRRRRARIAGVAALAALAVAAPRIDAAPAVVVTVGDPSPLGLPFSTFSDAVVDDRGRVAFVGASAALFQRTGSGLVHVVGAGDRLLGRQIAGVGVPALGAGECLAFRALFVGGGAGIFLRCAASAVLVADTETVAPDVGPFVGFGDETAVGAGGRVAFTAVLADGTAVLLLADPDGTFREIVRTGAPSPTGGTFSSVRLVGLSAAGQVGFRGAVSNGPDGLFLSDGTTLSSVAIVGDASPAGGGFTAVGLAAMNDDGVWAFRAVVSSGPRQGVFRASPGAGIIPQLTTVALEGDPTPTGGSFGQFPSSLVPSVSSGGSVAFRATIDGGASSSAVFVVPPGGAPTQVVAVGEETAVGKLVRLRDVEVGDDGSVLVRASIAGGGPPGLFRARGGQIDGLAVLGDGTDLGAGFRFADSSVRGSVDTAVFLGLREAVFVGDTTGGVRSVATLGEPTPLGGHYSTFDPPAAGSGGRIVFGASITGGRAAEALLVAGRRQPRVLARLGQRVAKHVKLADLFSDPLDNLARASLGPGSVAFQAALSGEGGGSGIVVARGGGLTVLARDGERAPGAGTYRQFGTPAALGAGAAFVALGSRGTTALFRVVGGAARVVAAAEADTGTRLHGTFQTFDAPAASGRTVAFKATLDRGAREGVFAARGRCVMALAGSGESEPGGGHFKGFGIPTFAGRSVVFRAAALGGSASTAIYRSIPSGGCTQVPPPVDVLAVAGTAAPRGGSLLGFGTPSGNRRGDVAFSVDLTGAGGGDAIVYVP